MAFPIFLVLELSSAILATPASLIFFGVICVSQGVQFKWRFTLFLVFLSSLTLSADHAVRTMLYLLRYGLNYDKSYFLFSGLFLNAAPPLITISNFEDEDILIYTYTLAVHIQSFSVLLFAIIQFLTVFLPDRVLDSVFSNIFFYVTTIVMIIISNLLTQVIVFSDDPLYTAMGAGLVLSIDITSFILFIFISFVSKKTYEKQLGEVTLEKKYQVSQVYTWSRTMIPSIMIAKVIRFISMISIIGFFDFDTPEETDVIPLSIFQIFMDTYIICLVVWIIIKHKKLGRKLFAVSDITPLRTIDEPDIRRNATMEEHMEFLHNQWEQAAKEKLKKL